MATAGLIALGVMPSLVWIFFYLQEDINPEPKRMLLFVFSAGAIATFFVVGVENYFSRVILPPSVSPYDTLSLFGLAFIEEVFKFFIVFLAIRKSRDFDEPVDAMIYMITGALGFAAVENIGVIFNSQQVIMSGALEITILRFIGATLLHSLTAGFVGYYWAVGILRRRVWRYIALGLLGGTILHTIFNYLILRFDPEIYPTLFLAVFAFFILGDFEKLRGNPTQSQSANGKPNGSGSGMLNSNH